MNAYLEKTILTEEIYTGSIIRVERLTVELPNGKTATRDVVRHQGAAAVVPMTDDGRVILVKQYRVPNRCISIEIPAGKLDPDETPECCAARELREETGYAAEKLVKLFAMKSTPGFSDEIIHVYLATGLTGGTAHPDADEFISSFTVSMEEAIRMIHDGDIADGKTIAGLYAANAVRHAEHVNRF